jgi:carbon-monoxide dehydrogenase medium subunit
VKPPPFEYQAVRSAEEAVRALAERGPEARILAGGQSLIPMLKLRLARPAALIDINRARELDYLRIEDGALVVGATARMCRLESDEVRRHCPLVAEAARHVGHAAIRHRSTPCGSVAHGDPAAEMPLVAACLDAELRALGPRGSRTIGGRDFQTSYFTTALAPDELLAEMRLPVLARGAGWAFLELTKRAGDFAIVAVAVSLERGPGHGVLRPRIALGAVAERPLRCPEAEAALDGQPGTRETFRAAAATATARLEPPSDVHGSGSYRRTVAQALLERALGQAWDRAGAAASGGEGA